MLSFFSLVENIACIYTYTQHMCMQNENSLENMLVSKVVESFYAFFSLGFARVTFELCRQN